MSTPTSPSSGPSSAPAPAPSPAAQEITKDTLAAAANRDDAATKELLRGTGTERATQVERARTALKTLQEDMAGTKNEEKARIARAARELMDEHLATVETELRTGMDVKLNELQKRIEETRKVAVLEERGAMGSLSVEAVAYDAKEITRELRRGDWKTWAMYAGVAAGAGLAAKWVWDHSIGWLWKKAAGDDKKPGMLRKAAGWLAAGGAAVAGAVGFHYWRQNGGKISATGNAAVDVPAGVVNVATRNADRMATLLGQDIEFVNELLNGDPEKFWDTVTSKGGHLAYQHGEVVLTILGESVTLPLQFGQKCIKRMTSGKWDKDTWLVYGEAGAAYFFGKQTLQALLRGELTAELSLRSAVTTIYQVGAWPADMATDIYKLANTAAYTGGRGVMLRYVAPTWPMRSANYAADLLYTPDCKTTKGLEAALQRWKQIQADCDIMKKSPTFFEEDIVKLTNERRTKLAGLIQDGLKNADVADDAPDYLKTLKAQVDLGLEAFEGKMDEAILAGKIAPSAEAAEDLAQAARTGAAATDAATDAADATADAGRATAATTDAVTETAETGDEWARAATAARKALLAPDATDEAARSVDEAIAACKAIGMTSADAVKAVRDPSSLLALTRTPRQYATALAVANESGDAVQNLRRIGAFLAGFDKLDDAARAAKIFDKNLLRTLAQSGLEPDGIANILKNPALKGALDKVDDLDGVVKGLIWWEHTKSIGGMINVGGAVISAVMLGVDIASYVEMRNRLTETIKNLEANLRKAGFEKRGDDFIHPKTQKKISVSLLSENVNNLSREQAYRVGAGVVGTGAALATVIAPTLALGPAGLIILGVHLVVEGGLVVAGDQRSREFLRDTPTSVLAMIGMGQTVGKSEKDVLDESSSWLWSDVWNWEETNEADKALFRKKAVSVMFFQELGSLMKDSPEVAMRVLAESNRSQGGEGPQLQDAGTFLDEENGAFWKKDFDAIIKPYLAARLFQMSKDSTVKWSNFRDLKIDEGVFDWENVSAADMRLALREAAHVYAQHLKEKSYLDEKKAAAELAARPRQELVTTVQSIETRAHLDLQTAIARENAKALGTQGAFGKSVAELDDGSGTTSMERYLADLTKRLDGRADASAAETKKAYDESDSAQAVDVALLLGGVVRVPDANAGKDRASMGKEEIFTGANPGAEGNVRLEDLAGAAAREKERPLAVADVQGIVEKGRSLYGELEPVGTAMRADSVWYAQPSHFQKLKEYSYALRRQPAIENEKTVQAFLGTVKTLSEGFSWEDGYFGSEFLAKRNDAFRASIAALAAMNRALDKRTYHLAPVERATTRDELVCVPGRERFLFFPGADVRGDPSVLYVESGGKTIEHRPVPGREYKETVPGGMLMCRMQGRMEKGKQVYDYTWSFERGTDAKPGTELYAYMKSDGAEQPGVRVTLPEVKTKRLRINVARAIATESIDGMNGTAMIALTYRTPEGSEETVKGTLHEVLQSKKVGWKRLANTDPKTGEKAEWTEFVPKDGITLVRCQVDHFDRPQSTIYEWPKRNAAPVVATPPAKVNRAA